MWLQTKHRNWALLCAFVCVLGGAFGFGDEPDERLFRNRTRSARGSGGNFSQSHQVLDSIHEDLLADSATVSGNSISASADLHAASADGFLEVAEPVCAVASLTAVLPDVPSLSSGRAPPAFSSSL